MASPLSKELIAGAIGESGSPMGTLTPVPLAEAEKVGVRFATKVGAKTLADLRKIPARQLLDATAEPGYGRFPLAIDGYFLPKDPIAIFAAGEQARVPLLVGWNSEESTFRAVLGREEPTRENLAKAVQRLYGERASEVLKVYQAASDAEVQQVANDLAGDRFIGFSTWKWADLHSRTGGKPLYRYLYAHPRPAISAQTSDPGRGGNGAAPKGAVATANRAPAPRGAVHSAEIEYAMGNLATNRMYAWNQDDFRVSEIMEGYFANFVKTGDPNGPGLPSWPAANQGGTVQVMHIDVNTRSEPDEHRERYLLLERLSGKKTD
jgi:para-nitrobenzyl esterase